MKNIAFHMLIILLFGLATLEMMHAVASPAVTDNEKDDDLVDKIARTRHYLRKRQDGSKPDFHSATVDPNLIAKLARAKIGPSLRFRRHGYQTEAVNRDLETAQVETAEAAIEAEEAKDSSIEALLANSKLQQDLKISTPNTDEGGRNRDKDRKSASASSSKLSSESTSNSSSESSSKIKEHRKTQEVDNENDEDSGSTEKDDVNSNIAEDDGNDHGDEPETDADEEEDSDHDDSDDQEDDIAHETIVEDDNVTVTDIDINSSINYGSTGQNKKKNGEDKKGKGHEDKDEGHDDGDKDQGDKDKDQGGKDKDQGGKDKDHGDKDKDHGDKGKDHLGASGPSVCQGLLDFKRMSDDFRSRLQTLIEQEEAVVARLEKWEKTMENSSDLTEAQDFRKSHKKGSGANGKSSKLVTKACVIIEAEEPETMPKSHSRSHSKSHKSKSFGENKGIPIIEARIHTPEDTNRRNRYHRFRSKKIRKVVRESEPQETHAEASGDIDLENIYWVKPSNYKSHFESSAASKNILNRIYKNGQDVLIVPISSRFRNGRDVATSFLKSFRTNVYKTKRNAEDVTGTGEESKTIDNWKKGSKVIEAENPEKSDRKFKMTIRRV